MFLFCFCIHVFCQTSDPHIAHTSVWHNVTCFVEWKQLNLFLCWVRICRKPAMPKQLQYFDQNIYFFLQGILNRLISEFDIFLRNKILVEATEFLSTLLLFSPEKMKYWCFYIVKICCRRKAFYKKYEETFDFFYFFFRKNQNLCILILWKLLKEEANTLVEESQLFRLDFCFLQEEYWIT
jgi:hypothetical protein